MNSYSNNTMKSASKVRRTQRGAFLLEALIGILIFSLGILGIVGLQARAIRFTNDAELRAEAMYLANSLIAQMWTDQRSLLKNKYDSTVGTGIGYTTFKAKVNSTLPGGIDPVVIVDGAAPLPQANTVSSNVVQVKVSWLMPGDPVLAPHNYTATGIIGQQTP
jgi:type IV pilus assembly protein PilV